MKGPLRLRFLLSAKDLAQLEPTDAEVAVVGRSNVGKSSLINALGGSGKLALVSKTPGRTRLLNQFALAEGGTLVDMPGYGYAAASGSERASWQRMAERYLLERDELVKIVVLVDGEIGPTKLDVQMLEWLRSYERPHVIVATKHDKVKSSHREKRKQELAAGCGVGSGDVVWVSAAKGVGIDRLRGLVVQWLAAN
ncbi:MAG TPA: ribosome biogenesis GTP-binding protein YihA/YsxC [Acidimicrobiales bacterium]|nr:ribosome biogenesis GTP-binding protein YihA/YsxC [Acidimicrobiales bacterium]